MATAAQQQSWATLAYRTALAFGFLLSAMLFSAGFSFGFMGFDLTSPWAWWAAVAMLNPFVGLAIRHIYAARFNNARNLALLGGAIGAVVGLHIALTLGLG